MILEDTKKDVVNLFLDRGLLISPDVFLNMDNINQKEIQEKIETKKFGKDKPIIINNDIFSLICSGNLSLDINWYEFDKAKTNLEKGRIDKSYNIFLDILNYGKKSTDSINNLINEIKEDKKEIAIEEEKDKQYNVVVLKSYFDKQRERGVSDFSVYYNNRYNALKKMLLNRPELTLSTSISRVLNKNQKEETTIIGMIYD